MTVGGDGRLSRIQYESGHENSPGDPFGRTTLTLEADGRARLDNLFVGQHRAWEGRVVSATLDRLAAALHRSGFPTVPEHMLVPGTELRDLTVSGGAGSGRAILPWHQVTRWPGYDEAFAILDGLVNRLSGGAIPLGADDFLRDEVIDSRQVDS